MQKRERIFLASIVSLSLILFSAPLTYSFEFEVEMDNFAFVPHGTHVNVGDIITWRNRDAVQHSSTSDNGIWDSGLLSRDQTFSYTFTSNGAFPYHCSAHPSMKDTIFVGLQSGIGDLNQIPTQFELAQNYPNPFNARTTIGYGLPTASHISLTIYDILGQKITTLVDAYQPAGEYQINWDAASQSSGIYFYRLDVGGMVETKRMSLLK